MHWFSFVIGFLAGVVVVMAVALINTRATRPKLTFDSLPKRKPHVWYTPDTYDDDDDTKPLRDIHPFIG